MFFSSFGSLGRSRRLELSFKPRDVALGLLELLLRKLLHIRVGQHFRRVSELLLRPLVCAVCFDDRLKLVPFTQQPRRAGRIIVQIRRGQAHFQLVEPRGQHFQFLKHNLSPNRAIHQRPVSISPIMEQYSRQRTPATDRGTVFSPVRLHRPDRRVRADGAPGEMVVIRDDRNRRVFGQQLFRVRDILDGRTRCILQDQPRRVGAVRRHVVPHSLRLGARLVAALSAAQDGAALRIGIQHADRRVTARGKRR